MRAGGGGGAALAAMTDGAAEFLERMLLVQRVVGQRLRVAAVAGIFHRQMAGGATVHAIQFGQHDLPDFDGEASGHRLLLRSGRAADFLLDVLALLVLPFAVLSL